MDFRPNDSQRLLVNVAREFLEKNCPPTLVQEQALDERGFRENLWNQISSLGWVGLLVPASFGGSEASLVDVILLIEEMGRACFPSPFLTSAVVATSLLVKGGSPQQQQRLLPAMALGDHIVTLALVEESASFEPDALALTGEAGGRITGRKLFVKDAHVANHLIVVTRGNGGFNLVLVETGRRGVTLVPMPTISGEKLFEVGFEDVDVRQEDLLGPAGQGWTLLTPALRVGALARSAEMVGCAQKILELTAEYAKVRVQSGRPIGSFQAIQHQCADLLRNVEAARYLVYNATWKADEGFDCDADVAMAKAYAGDNCLAAARKAHQTFGAIAYCEEHPLHLFHKRIQAASLDFGDRAAHLETVAGAIGLV